LGKWSIRSRLKNDIGINLYTFSALLIFEPQSSTLKVSMLLNWIDWLPTKTKLIQFLKPVVTGLFCLCKIFSCRLKSVVRCFLWNCKLNENMNKIIGFKTFFFLLLLSKRKWDMTIVGKVSRGCWKFHTIEQHSHCFLPCFYYIKNNIRPYFSLSHQEGPTQSYECIFSAPKAFLF
jgi:hypothetical protein